MSEVVSQITSTLFGTNGVIPTVFTWVTSAAVLPYFAISVAISLTLVGVKIIRSVIYGA